MIGSDEDIKPGSTYGRLLGTILGNVDVITLGVGVGIDMGSLDVSFYGYNDDKLDGSFMGESLGSDDLVEVGATDSWSDPNPNPNPKLGYLYGYFDRSNGGKLFWFIVWFSFSFMYLLTPLVLFCQYGRVQCLVFY